MSLAGQGGGIARTGFAKLAAMQETVSTTSSRTRGGFAALISRARVEAPDLPATSAALLSSVLLVIAFPDFNLWPLAWIGLVPLLVVIVRRPAPMRSFLLGWLTGSLFFYASCYWLTFSMIHYGKLPAWLAYLLLVPGALVVGIFPGLFALILAIALRRWHARALFLSPFLWIAFEWARLGVTGQLWNALGYSQAFQPLLIQTARWGGVYAVSFLLVLSNVAIAFAIVKATKRGAVISVGVLVAITFIVLICAAGPRAGGVSNAARVFAIQPNVPMHLAKSSEELRDLTERHLLMTQEALRRHQFDGIPQLVIWPESPMNFAYASDAQFRELITRFAQDNNVSIIFNSQEPAPNDGIYNSAMLINEDGKLIGQYDKIRLLPFGEYVPVPRWLPGASLITAIVGDFIPGASYTMLPIGEAKTGVFICVESAYPSIARTFANDGADVLINISNDGYLGRTAVMRQHLANAVFRAVENGRPVLRVTNTGITAYIAADGSVKDETPVFETAVRVWTVGRSSTEKTFYTRNGDWFAMFCGVLTILIFVGSLYHRGRGTQREHRK